jgi:hypothetical protein
MDHRILTVRTNNKVASVGSLNNGYASIGKLRNMPADFTRYATVRQGGRSRVVAKSARDLEHWFSHQWMRYCTDRSFETGSF